MAPPQIFINTKTLELEKRSDIEKEDGCENYQEREDHKKDKEDGSDASDPSENANEKDESRKSKFPFPLPIHSYILMFTGLAIALAGVSYNKNDYKILNSDLLNSPAVSDMINSSF